MLVGWETSLYTGVIGYLRWDLGVKAHAHALKTPRATLIMIVGALFYNKIVETLSSHGVTLENKTIHTLPFSPPVKVVVFVIFFG